MKNLRVGQTQSMDGDSVHELIYWARATCSRAPMRLFHAIGPSARELLTLLVDFSPHPRITGSTIMCKDAWMGIIDEPRAKLISKCV